MKIAVVASFKNRKDAKGKVLTYTITRTGTPKKGGRGKGVEWGCKCPDFQKRKKTGYGGPCKHMKGLWKAASVVRKDKRRSIEKVLGHPVVVTYQGARVLGLAA